MARATARVAPTAPRRHEPQGTACPVPPADGPDGAGDRKGRPYGTATARTAGDGLVPSRQPTEPRWRGRPQGSPLRRRDGTNRRGRACPVPPADGTPMARATARVAPAAPRRHEPQGTGLSRPASRRNPDGAGDRKGRPCGAATARTVGDGLVPSRQPTEPRWRGRPQGSPLRPATDLSYTPRTHGVIWVTWATLC